MNTAMLVVLYFGITIQWIRGIEHEWFQAKFPMDFWAMIIALTIVFIFLPVILAWRAIQHIHNRVYNGRYTS